MSNFTITQKALDDLSLIWKYTFENWSEKQADKYYQLIILGCSELSKNPKIGKTYFEIYPGLYGKLFSKHIVFYRKNDDFTIEITRILHEKMDLKKNLRV